MDLGTHSANLASGAATALRAERFHTAKKFAGVALISVTALWPHREQRAEE